MHQCNRIAICSKCNYQTYALMRSDQTCIKDEHVSYSLVYIAMCPTFLLGRGVSGYQRNIHVMHRYYVWWLSFAGDWGGTCHGIHIIWGKLDPMHVFVTHAFMMGTDWLCMWTKHKFRTSGTASRVGQISNYFRTLHWVRRNTICS